MAGSALDPGPEAATLAGLVESRSVANREFFAREAEPLARCCHRIPIGPRLRAETTRSLAGMDPRRAIARRAQAGKNSKRRSLLLRSSCS